eukprot:4754323-Heterocapsa_arctica.AAC.1
MLIRPLLSQSGFKGSLLKEAKYLGSKFSAEGSNAPDIFDRLEKANQAWRLLGRTLHCSSVSFSIRLMLYRATVVGALLSGLEAAVLTRDQLKQLEVFM